jgi:thioredoxin
MPHEITSVSEFNNYTSGLAIIDFYAPWCGPCKNIAPIFDQLSKDPKYKSIQFLKLNVDEQDEIANKLGVQSLPTFMTFKNNKGVGMFKGASQEHLINLINNLLKI